jgi:hypothetical protein
MGGFGEGPKPRSMGRHRKGAAPGNYIKWADPVTWHKEFTFFPKTTIYGTRVWCGYILKSRHKTAFGVELKYITEEELTMRILKEDYFK